MNQLRIALMTMAVLIPVRVFSEDAAILELVDLLPEQLYRSSAILQLDFPEIDYLPEGGLVPEIARRVESTLVRMKSRSLVEDIVEELHLAEDIDGERERRDLFRRISQGIDIREVGPYFYEFSSIYTNPLACRDIVNLLIRSFIREMIERQDRAIEEKMAFINRELNFYQKQNEALWERLREFQINNLEYLTTPPAFSDPLFRLPEHHMFERYRKRREKLLDLESELKLLTAKLRRLEKILEDTERTVISSREVDQLNGTVLAVTETLNPVYREAELELFRKREKIASLEDKIELFRAYGKSSLESVKKLPDIIREYSELSREYGKNSRAIENLMQDREEVSREMRIRLGQRGTTFLIIDSAEVSLQPYEGEEAVSLLSRSSTRGDNLFLRTLLKFFFH